MSDTEQPRVAIVTGGTRGIGRSISLDLARKGIVVIATYKSNDFLAESLHEISREENLALNVQQQDIDNIDSTSMWARQVIERFGAVDILVNNAGITLDELVIHQVESHWDQVLQTNLKGHVFLTKSCLFAMLKNRFGCIINISSVAGLYGNVGQTAYSATKSALLALTGSWAREYGRFGVRCNAVIPALVETDMSSSLPEKVRDAILKKYSLEYPLSPTSVSSVVSFLCSDKAVRLNGQSIAVGFNRQYF